MTNFYIIAVDNEDHTIESRWLDEDVVIPKKQYENFLKITNECARLKVRYMAEKALKNYGGTPIDWACYKITDQLNGYLSLHNVDENTSLTEKRMHTIAFAHALEDKLLDYLNKLEEFNS